MKKHISIILALMLFATALFGCDCNGCNGCNDGQNQGEYFINGVDISSYTIVYDDNALDYTINAVQYLKDEIKSLTGVEIDAVTDAQCPTALSHEIVVGETNRPISTALDAETQGFEFSMLANENHIAIEGDYFVIAGAVYYFVETYIDSEPFSATIPMEEKVHEPITKQSKSQIFLIGDGMGFNHTLLFEDYSAEQEGYYSDGENAFYGYMLPYQGKSKTKSLSGTTDSAAGGTALATGYKTYNGYVGKDGTLNNVKSLTEIAIELNKSTAVMSTETLRGATPASFTTHTSSRNNSNDIKAQQNALTENHGTIIKGKYGASSTQDDIKNKVEKDLKDVLSVLSTNPNGFFMMYEEAYIDKFSHSNDIKGAFSAVLRFNQIIGCVMEYAFYHPDVAVIITADHETGGITLGDDGFYYTRTNHSSADVPIFAYGHGMSVFDGVTIENIQIPKTLAKNWGVNLIGYDNENYPALNAD